MKRWILPAVAAAAALTGTAAMAQPYGYYGGSAYGYDRGHDHGRAYHWRHYRDRRPDRWDRWERRRERHYWRESYRRGYAPAPYYGYGYRY
jgi:hypothetical protein